MTDEPDEALPRRGGRPPSKKRGKFAFRVTADLREQLEASAEASGKPVSEEIEARLEASYREPYLISKATEQIVNIAVDGVLKVQYEKFGGTESYFSAEQFALCFSIWLKEIDAEHPQDELPWYRNDDKISALRYKFMNVAPALIDLIATSRKNQNKTLEEIAWQLGISTNNLSKQEIQEKISDKLSEI